MTNKKSEAFLMFQNRMKGQSLKFYDNHKTNESSRKKSPKAQKHFFFKTILFALAGAMMLPLLAFAANKKTPQKNRSANWSAYGSDAGGSRHSTLTQINKTNVGQLQIAWTYKTGEAENKSRLRGKSAFEATPLFIDDTLYFSTPFSRVIALDPTTGKERWTYDPQVDLTRGYSEVTSRGVSTWLPQDGKAARRIYIATLDARLIALDATTGKPVADFGDNGEVDLKRDIEIVNQGQYQITSPPAVINDLLVVGSSMGDNRAAKSERGVVRAYDARTGKLRWVFDPIPPDAKDPANKTWKEGSAARTGAANAWSVISADPQRDLVFVPTSSPSPDFYGGERKGDNRYANSLVAIRASTGKVVWHFQVVHHDLWDYDVAAQPTLVTVKRNGRDVAAVAVATKMGFVYVLDRNTGKPVFPVEERAVPQTDVAGEESSPTQPFPTFPRPLVPTKLAPEDAWGPTDKDREYCREKIKSLRSEGIFTPPSLKGSLLFPGNVGGVNWGSMSYDASRNLLVMATNRLATTVRLIPQAEYSKLILSGEGNRLKGEFGPQRGTPYAMYREPLVAPSGAPCNAPPWGTLTAVDLKTGEVKWEAPLGKIPQIAMFPKSAEWGSINLGGPMTTASGLVFIAAAMDEKLRAFDAETGKLLWEGQLPASAQATPMTYRVGDKQFVIICAGGHGKLGTKMGDAVVAFALP
jgi:quinoprotein glucose dehydrogenase